MITIQSFADGAIQLLPTIFPDGTSQIWKLPPWVISTNPLRIVWNFETEREIIDLISLFRLIPKPDRVWLHIPYLPYARQDKLVANDATFNLTVFADLINQLKVGKITTVDVHSPAAEILINRLENLEVTDLHTTMVHIATPDVIVFPDAGASNRYSKKPFEGIPSIFFRKTRDPATGAILGLEPSVRNPPNMSHIGGIPAEAINRGAKILIVDDLCDGGATFVEVAKYLRGVHDDLKITLFVTHGIFSRGRQFLYSNGIDQIYTTNSILKNEGFKV